MIISKPIITLLHNSNSGRWHPILFVEYPLPGDAKLTRHKSKGHHSEGYDTRQAAEQGAEELSARIPGATLLLSDVTEWDGSDIPACVRFFPSMNADTSADGTSVSK